MKQCQRFVDILLLCHLSGLLDKNLHLHISFKSFPFLKLCLCPGGSVVESACNAADARDIGFDPLLGRCPGGELDNPLQNSCLENPLDRGAWRATVHGVAKELDML